MSINIDNNTLAIWYVELQPGVIDYMGALTRRDYGYSYTWRMRYYNSSDQWDTNDVKRWFNMEVPSAHGDEEDEGAISIIRETVLATVALSRVMGKPEPGAIHELLRDKKTLDEFVKEITESPFVHKRKVTRQ
jgi:hypothetical protein